MLSLKRKLLCRISSINEANKLIFRTVCSFNSHHLFPQCKSTPRLIHLFITFTKKNIVKKKTSSTSCAGSGTSRRPAPASGCSGGSRPRPLELPRPQNLQKCQKLPFKGRHNCAQCHQFFQIFRQNGFPSKNIKDGNL